MEKRKKWAIVTQKIAFKREFSVLFDAVKAVNEQYLEEKIQPVRKVVAEKIQNKVS